MKLTEVTKTKKTNEANKTKEIIHRTEYAQREILERSQQQATLLLLLIITSRKD